MHFYVAVMSRLSTLHSSFVNIRVQSWYNMVLSDSTWDSWRQHQAGHLGKRAKAKATSVQRRHVIAGVPLSG